MNDGDSGDAVCTQTHVPRRMPQRQEQLDPAVDAHVRGAGPRQAVVDTDELRGQRQRVSGEVQLPLVLRAEGERRRRDDGGYIERCASGLQRA